MPSASARNRADFLARVDKGQCFVRHRVDAGMDVARISCAHGDATARKAMVKHMRRAPAVL